MKIGLVTDSTADLPQELVEELEIEVVPLQVIIGDRQYQDGIELDATTFYEKLTTSGPHLPRTSQPAPGVFIERYNRLLKKVDAILSIHITGKLSGTIQSAQMASTLFPAGKVHVIDSYSTSMGLGSLVLEAAYALRRGVSIDQIMARLCFLRERISFYVVLDTLEYIFRGGRVSRLQHLFGSILKIKPLLKLTKGEVEVVGRARSKNEALKLLVEKFQEENDAASCSIISVMHTAAETEALKLKAIVEEYYKKAEIMISQAGPVLGTHTGPGALALIALPK